MTRRAFRVLLFLGLLGTAALAGYQGWKLERARVQQLASADTFDSLTLRLTHDVVELRAAQRAYVASGQGFAFWKPSVDKRLQQIRQDLTTLKTSAAPGAATSADAALEALNDSVRLEKRIAEAAEAGRVQFAADLVFADGLQASLALERAVNSAIAAARGDLAAYQRDARIQELLLAAESAGIGLFLALMWFPARTKPATGVQTSQANRASRAASATSAGSDASAAATAGAGVSAGRAWADLPLRTDADTQRADAPRGAAARDRLRPTDQEKAKFGDMLREGARTAGGASGTQSTSSSQMASKPSQHGGTTGATVATGAAPASAITSAAGAGASGGYGGNASISAAVSRDTLAAAADLCTSFARVNDAGELAALLAQMSAQLDAAGVIVWLAAPDGLSLRPALSHGYAPEALARLDRLDLAADNATARAYRLVRPQTVSAQDSTPGALVVPITTGAGCVGAVAAELRHGREQDATTIALARIFAAQLATLTGPSSGGATPN
jgi:hypothetical protein